MKNFTSKITVKQKHYCSTLGTMFYILITFQSINTHSQTLVNQLWEIELDYPQDVPWSASVLNSGSDLFTTGNTWHNDAQKVNIVTTKKNSGGSVVWSTEYNGTQSAFDYGAAICLDGSGNVYVTGATHNTSTVSFDIVVIKYNSSGTQQWATLFNGAGSGMDIPSGITLDGSGNVYVCGASTGSTTGYDYVTIKLNSSGTIQWSNMEIPVKLTPPEQFKLTPLLRSKLTPSLQSKLTPPVSRWASPAFLI